MNSDFTKNNSFCVAPWIHHYRSPTGKVGLCCVAKPYDSIETNSFDELRNSEPFKNARFQMMNGKLPDECSICNESNTNRYYKDDLNAAFPQVFEAILKQTSADGETTVQPLYLDYRFNECNLTCQTCNPDYSSSWLKEIQAKDKNFPSPILYRPEDKVDYHQFIKKYNWERIYFAGGEPLMQKDHADVLQILASKTNASKIEIYYNTNLSFNINYIKKINSLLSPFKHVGVLVSVDSFGKFNNLIRSGSDFDQVDKNIDYLRENLNPNTVLTIDLTITSLLFYNLIDFSNWVLEKKLNLNARMMTGNGYAGSILRIENLTLEFRKNMFNQWLNWFNQLDENSKNKLINLKEVLSSHLELPEISKIEEWHLKNISLELENHTKPELFHFIKYNMSPNLCFELNLP